MTHYRPSILLSRNRARCVYTTEEPSHFLVCFPCCHETQSSSSPAFHRRSRRQFANHPARRVSLPTQRRGAPLTFLPRLPRRCTDKRGCALQIRHALRAHRMVRFAERSVDKIRPDRNIVAGVAVLLARSPR